MPLIFLQYVNVVFPDHTHLLLDYMYVSMFVKGVFVAYAISTVISCLDHLSILCLMRVRKYHDLLKRPNLIAEMS